MGCCDDDHCASATLPNSPSWRRALWIALAINSGFFLTEIVAGAAAGSTALQADALDFFGDAANYAVSLGVAGMALAWRARAAFAKGGTLVVFALWVLGSTAWHAFHGTLPRAEVMGIVGLAALVANGGVALMLYRFRSGDANMRSVWICSRNDAVGNAAVLLAALVANGGVALMLYRFRSGDANMRSWICSRNDAVGNAAVLLAALGVFGTRTGWPDVIVATIMGGLGLWGGWQIVSHARDELRPASDGHAMAAE